MVNKCVVFGCKSGYTAKGGISSFRFPFRKPDLLNKWVQFVNRANWSPSSNSVICSKHFDEKFLCVGIRTKLKWKANPIPTKHTSSALKQPSSLKTPAAPRKPPTQRIFQQDELENFSKEDSIENFNDLSEKHAPPGNQFHKTEQFVVYYNLSFNSVSGFPEVLEAIKINLDLHVELQYRSNPVPLPSWFTMGRNAKLTKLSMLQNFPAYLRNVGNKSQDVIEELQQRQHYQTKGRPPYSCEMIRFALLLRYTSAQAYKILLGKLPLPSMSLLRKLKSGNLDVIKVAKLLRQNKSISDVVLMCDEMFLQKSSQYSGGQYVGVDENGTLFKGIAVFMIVGLKKSVPIVVKAVPEVTINGKWLAEELSKCIASLASAGFRVRGIVLDNHSANVAAFRSLLQLHPSDNPLNIKHPENLSKTYLFFDNVHLIKNIINNLLNARKFVFPSFSFCIKDQLVTSSSNGYISWRDLHEIYDEDMTNVANLRKAPKLTFKALHPGFNKQNVALALAIFDESTIAACKSYFPNRQDVSSFLSLINSCRTVVNSKTKFHPNSLGNAVVLNDGTLEFLESLATWFESW